MVSLAICENTVSLTQGRYKVTFQGLRICSGSLCLGRTPGDLKKDCSESAQKGKNPANVLNTMLFSFPTSQNTNDVGVGWEVGDWN